MNTETRRRPVRIGEMGNEVTYPIRWIRLLDGEKRGLDFAIPIEHPEYEEDLESKLQSLDEGDRVKMRFTSINQKRTSWLCSEIATEDDEILATQQITYKQQ